jgi:tetratricopeptide (TPR) repeat protein
LKWQKKRDFHIIEGRAQLRVGNYPLAEQSLVLALADIEQQHGSAARRAAILIDLAEAQRKQSRLGPAEQSIRQAMELIPETARGQCLDSLADIYGDSGNYPQQQRTLQESLGREEALPRPDSGRLAKLRHKLAMAFHNAGDHEAAAAHFGRAVALHEQAFGAEHAETGKLLVDLGSAQQRQGNHAEALRNLERALAIQEKTLGADSPEVANGLYQFALACEKSGNLEQAAAQFEQMLQLRQRLVGGNEMEVVDAYAHLSRLYASLGQLARAEETARSAILILERSPGPELASLLENLGGIYERADRREEAVEAYNRAREVRKVARASV